MKKGFTLAELLIALAILGVIATFTIPKVLQGQQDARFNSAAKEAISTISEMYGVYRMKQAASGATTTTDIMQYLNYVSQDTSSSPDDLYNGTTARTCSTISSGNNVYCYKLHSGGLIWLWGGSFGGTGSTNAMYFMFDPDAGQYSPTAQGPGKSIQFFLYFNGMIKDKSTILPATCNAFDCSNPNLTQNPPWFSWN